MQLEVCTQSVEGALTAYRAGAHRIELCQALPLDGLTPSWGMLEQIRQRCPDLKVNVLIRPREGDFVYTPDELQVMRRDIEAAHESGANGVVFGCLTSNGDVDPDANALLLEAAAGMETTFHRAFDQVRHPQQELEAIIRLGFTRILTSGQQTSALQGIPLIQELITLARGRISIMPGAGVSAANAARILRETGATEIHGSLRTPQSGLWKPDEGVIKTILQDIH